MSATSLTLPAGPDERGPVRTFKRRGRIRPGQAAALEDLWPRYGVDPGDAPLDPFALFGRVAPLVVEIGFGHGEATLAMAAADPGRDVLAIDVHRAGAGALLRDLDLAGLTNVRVVVGDAVPVLRDRLGPGVLDEVRVYFPDPWPKARHHKRRLVAAPFVALVASRLRPAGTLGADDPGGRLHCATDWEPYAEQMLAVVEADPRLHNGCGGFAPRPSWRPRTRFEEQGLAKGHLVRDVLAHRH
ncbi:MAG TPA: tRNA (guanine(46)-N(7))-methyltransferase TrmB [Kineosporiaceae bacterium]|nr:tRNA (guanine(46)-N(7))-methyltransferase TrmB [Kineosporiaceae bacterium]